MKKWKVKSKAKPLEISKKYCIEKKNDILIKLIQIKLNKTKTRL